MGNRYAFPKASRLRHRKEFARVFKRRCAASDGVLTVYVDANDLPVSRLGLSVSRRAGNAVKRHRIKRLLREAYRLNQHELPRGLDIVCIAKSLEHPSLPQYERSLLRLVQSAHGKLIRQPHSRRPDDPAP